jgi:hypothetical protein
MTPGLKIDPQILQALEMEIKDLESQIADLKSRFPAHSLSPAMLAQLDELDEALSNARMKLQDMGIDTN